MRKKRETETDQCRTERLQDAAQDRKEEAAAEDRAVDAAVRRSIKLHGP